MEGLPQTKHRKSYLDLSKQGRQKRLKRMRLLESSCSNDNTTIETVEPDTSHCEVFLPSKQFPRRDLGLAKERTVDDSFNFETPDRESDDSDSDDNVSDEEFEKFSRFLDDLRHWSVNYQITQVALTALLCVLRTHPCFKQLPCSPRTLLYTPINLKIHDVRPGQYCHLGLMEGIKCLWKHVVEKVSQIDIVIGIDGLPLFKSGPGEVWPIMASIVNVPSLMNKIFPVGVYYGKKKPEDCREFLKLFIEEAVSLASNGMFLSGQRILVCIKAFICDAPAKSFILGVKSHTGYSSCTRCKQTGDWKHNKVVFTKLDSQPRTHEEFLSHADEDFHVGPTNLHLLPNIDFVKSFPLDYMHLICLGVTRTLIYTWKFASPPLKLPSRVLNSISTSLLSFQPNIPSEFCRKPRGLEEVKRWKATELRQFLLYTGPVVLKKELKDTHPGYYENFLSLHIATRILLSPKYFKHLEYAKDLMKFFVETIIHYYGPQLMTHNFHNLLHIADDVANLKNLEIYNAFKFENFLGKLKRLVKSGNKPLQQIVRRLVELENNTIQMDKVKDHVGTPIFSKPHFNGPHLPSNEFKEQFQQLNFNEFIIKTTFPDSCCALKDGRIIIVYNMGKLESTNEMCLLFKYYLRKDDFFSQPFCNSSDLNIFTVKDLSTEFEICPINQISEKMVLLNSCNEIIVIPLLQHED